jgi:hypothetical protein
MPEEITEGVDEARKVGEGCDALFTRLEALHAALEKAGAVREVMQQRRQEHPIARCEQDSLPVQIPLQHGDLMAQSQDPCIHVPDAHRQQSQHREHAGRQGQPDEASLVTPNLGNIIDARR